MIRLRALDRKLVRDLWRLKWQSLAMALVIACGLSVAVMSYSSHESLVTAQTRYYSDTAFADVFATAVRAPLEIAGRAAKIDGVVAADPRMIQAGLMEVPGLVRPAVARVVSLPYDQRSALNRLVLKSGRLPVGPQEAVALDTFLQAAGVRLGDRLAVTLRGRRIDFTIVGAGLSPEYVYIPGAQSLLPDDAHQAVLWTTRPTLERAADLDGAFNALALKLAPGASERGVLAAVDRLLAPYGGNPAIAREDQPSHAIIESELGELQTTARVVPPIFLLVAAALVHMVIGRMVEVEREQIGLLKAFGYGDLAAAGFYARLALAIGLLGVTLGGVLGWLLGVFITDIYQDYMRFPVLSAGFNWTVFLLSSALALAVTVGGSLDAVRRAVRLSPAAALQPPRPPAYGKDLLSRSRILGALDQPSRIVLRHVQRYPLRSALTVCGLAASLTLLVGMQFMYGAIDHIIDQAYYRAQRSTHTIAFAEGRDAHTIQGIARFPGVYAAEPVRMSPARLFAGGRRETVAVTGLEPNSLMTRPLDRRGRPMPLFGDGVVLSEALAAKYGLEAGDRVKLELLERTRPIITAQITGLAEDYSGYSVYMRRGALNRLLGEGDVAGGANLLVDGEAEPAFYRAVARTPMVVGASSRDDTVENWRRTMAEAFQTTLALLVGFAAAIGFGVAYNIARISLAERGRDLATLRVLGYPPADCAYILLGEVAVLALIAIPVGLVGGWLLAEGIVHAYSREDLRMPAIITARSYALCLTIYTATVLAAAAAVAQRIWRLDLVSVLKTRE